MVIYLADLAHNYFHGINMVPLNVGYLKAYVKSQYGDNVEISLFKYPEDLLDAVEKTKPDLVGFSNYVWNNRLNYFVGNRIKQMNPDLPIVMGGPNIRTEDEGIAAFLAENTYVDTYCLFEGEIPFSAIVGKLLEVSPTKRNSDAVKNVETSGCYSLRDGGKLSGYYTMDGRTDLDFIPSPYLGGHLDPFLKTGLMPIFETNRGCPYTCSYCVWGKNNAKMKTFSLTRVFNDIEYVAALGMASPTWLFADANFGILKRDLEISKFLVEMHNKHKVEVAGKIVPPFYSLILYWDKNAKFHFKELTTTLNGLSEPYIAFQSMDPVVLELANRKNIKVERLMEMALAVKDVGGRLHTDILLGLPGETYQSHLDSLKKVLAYGFSDIKGGEVRLLPGSDLETKLSREKFGLKTKFRLVPESFGVYKNKFVFELEESIRSTNWISEKEMLSLRILRAIFFGSVTLGHFLPLVEYLKANSVDVVGFMHELIRRGAGKLALKNSIGWLTDMASKEWFNDIEAAEKHFSNNEAVKKVLNNAALKLNFSFLAKILADREDYLSFSRHIYEIIADLYPMCNPHTVQEILDFCEKRNFILHVLGLGATRGDRSQVTYETSVILSPATVSVLDKIGILSPGLTLPVYEADDRNCLLLKLSMDRAYGNMIMDNIFTNDSSDVVHSLALGLEKTKLIYMISAAAINNNNSRHFPKDHSLATSP